MFDGRIVVGIDMYKDQAEQLDREISLAEFHGLHLVVPILKQAKAAYEAKRNDG